MLRCNSTVKEQLAWLIAREMETEHGEVGLIFTKHQGCIVHIDRIDKTKLKPEKEDKT
jgi:hypothetical protein